MALQAPLQISTSGYTTGAAILVRENLTNTNTHRRFDQPSPFRNASIQIFAMSPREHVKASQKHIGGFVQGYQLPSTAPQIELGV